VIAHIALVDMIPPHNIDHGIQHLNDNTFLVVILKSKIPALPDPLTNNLSCVSSLWPQMLGGIALRGVDHRLGETLPSRAILFFIFGSPWYLQVSALPLCFPTP